VKNMVDKTGPLLYYMDMKRIMAIFVILAFIAAARAGAEPFAWAKSNYTDKVFKTVTDVNEMLSPSLKGKIVKFVCMPRTVPSSIPLCEGLFLVNNGFFQVLYSQENDTRYRAYKSGKIRVQEKSSTFYIFIPDDELLAQMCADIKQATGKKYGGWDKPPLGMLIGINMKSGLGSSSYRW
jgi:uncharacterized protein (UPF0333 family)